MTKGVYDPSLVARLLAQTDPATVSAEDWAQMKDWLAAVKSQDTVPPPPRIPVADKKDAPPRPQRKRLLNQFSQVLKDAGITSGRVAELGGPFNSFAADMPEFEFQYLSLYPVAGRDDVLVADITQCEYLEPEQFDVIFSVSVLEHVSKPWLAADQMTRLLKPGGIMYHSAPFSYFYHGAPADFWRYTPDAMRLLFSELEPISAEFNGLNRRRDNRGSPSNAVDKDGGNAFAVDAFGGWRENWSTVYVGRKNPEWLAARMEAHRLQLIVNLTKYLTKHGMTDADAFEKVSKRLKGLDVNRDGEVVLVPEGSGLSYTPKEVWAVYKRRTEIRPSYAMYVHARKAGF